MTPPRNYQELRQQARQEIYAKILELNERAANMQTFLAYADSITDMDSYTAAIKATHIDDCGDEQDLSAIWEIADNWPGIASKPGEGYW